MARRDDDARALRRSQDLRRQRFFVNEIETTETAVTTAKTEVATSVNTSTLPSTSERVSRVERRASVVLEHDTAIEIGLSVRAAAPVGAERAFQRYPKPAAAALLRPPRLLVVVGLLASVPMLDPAGVAPTGVIRVVGEVRAIHKRERVTFGKHEPAQRDGHVGAVSTPDVSPKPTFSGIRSPLESSSTVDYTADGTLPAGLRHLGVTVTMSPRSTTQRFRLAPTAELRAVHQGVAAAIDRHAEVGAGARQRANPLAHVHDHRRGPRLAIP